jgi:16S rRNA (cytosine967-C5)-methyltransferase
VQRLDARERAFAHELTYGVTRLRGRLDHLLSAHVHRGLESLDPTVHELLRIGSYQLLYMGGVADYAAVSETVDQVREEVGPRPAGFVNAVLRNVKEGGDGPERFPPETDEPATFLATWGSHPRWLIERWLRRWSFQEVRALVEMNNRRPALNLHALEVDPDEAVRLLAGAGIRCERVGSGSACVRLAEGTSPSAALAAIPCAIIQDPAANLVARYSDVPSGTKVADLCAAPGGKVLAASDRPLYTLASDRSESRIHMVRDNARRTGREMGFVVADARQPPVDTVDVVLLDVPCTGTGTLSRHPDGRWRLRPGSIDEMASLQGEMLEAAADVVAPGGVLVYSTCTLEPEENVDRVHAFLRSHQDFHVEVTGSVPSEYLDLDGFLSITPHATGFDGAFAARLRRAR